jgi:DHA1 family multidrug resistance protein-like MFS transporter
VAGWKRTLYIMFVAQLLSTVGFSTIFPFLPQFVAELGSSTGLSVEFWAAMVFSGQAFTMMIASPIWGALSDRYGRKLMVQRAMFGGTVIIFLMAFAQSAEQLTLLRAIQGAVTGVVAAANTLVAATAPKERMGYAMGVMQVALFSGVAVGPLIGGVVADFISIQAAFYITAALLLFGGLLVHFGVQENFTPSKTSKKIAFFADWKHVFVTPGVGVVFVIRFIGWLGRNMFVPFLPFFVGYLLVNDAYVSTVTGMVYAVSAAAGTLSGIFLGRLGDRIGHRRVLLMCALLAAVAYLPQALVTAAWQLLALQALAGLAAGGMMPALSALLHHYTTRGEEGSVYGLDNAIVAASRAVAPMVGAAVVSLVGLLYTGGASEAVIYGYRATFTATGIFYLVTALIAAWYLPERHPQPRADAVPADD